MSDDCVFETAAGAEACGTRHQGREAVRKAFAAAWETVPDAQWRDGVHHVSGRLRRIGMDLHRHRRRRQPHRGQRRRPVHLQGRQDPAQERVPQDPAQPAGLSADGAVRPIPPRATTRTYDPLVAPGPGAGPGLRAHLVGGQRRRAARGRRPGAAGHGCRRGHHRLRRHRPVDRAVPGAGARHPRRGAGSQPGRLGLLQPQRRPGPERQRPAQALAMDRALGPGRGAGGSTPRSAPASTTFAR